MPKVSKKGWRIRIVTNLPLRKPHIDLNLGGNFDWWPSMSPSDDMLAEKFCKKLNAQRNSKGDV